VNAESDRAALAEAKEVRIETRAADGTVHSTIIWIMVVGDVVYIRSYRGATARWYREAIASPEVAIVVGRRRIPFRAVPATDAASVAACSEGLRSKYRRSYSLEAMLVDEVLPTTLRLEPRPPD
jgi:hypothetical protein